MIYVVVFVFYVVGFVVVVSVLNFIVYIVGICFMLVGKLGFDFFSDIIVVDFMFL